ncbi:MAG: DUF4255 domain-containing protein [bacterium]|nr:DUF4255 domain-containing protein [bacterium]
MALSDLSLVTRAFIAILRESFHVSPAWSSETAPTITPEPPDKVNGNGLGFYLYHIMEDGHYKNLPAGGIETPPVRYVPMALNLFYQLSASSTTDEGSGALLEQQMMGIAMKALHDYPFIDDTTTINGLIIFPALLRGANNRIKIVLQPIPPSEAVHYWTAGTSPLNLAAYYQVSVILLEPEKIRSRGGRVLAYGVHTFLEGAPRIDNSENKLSFTIPDEPGQREITLRPAQVPVGGRITFTGTGLGGDGVSLFLKNIRWDDAVKVDPAWAIAATSDEITADVRETASSEDILPGVYSAFIKVSRKRALPGGRVRDFEHNSNESPFTISPRIDDISAPDPNNIVTVRGYIFRHAALPVSAVSVYLSDVALTWRPPPDPLTPGDFIVSDPPPGETLPILQFMLPAGLTSGQEVPVRIFVNGAESPPEWITIP